MADVSQVIRDIKSLRIQGAQAVANEAVKAIKQTVTATRAKTPNTLLLELSKTRNLLIKARSTEPCLRNALLYVFKDLPHDDLRVFKREILLNIQEAQKHIRDVNRRISDIGSMKIKNGMIVFTHCHSSTVVNILKEAKKQGKRFSVHNTETRPRFQGRITALELSRAGIPVTHFVDSAARLALKKADIMLIGADAITAEGKVINKIGSELFAEVAGRYDIPVYSCTDSWKFDPETIFGFEEPIESRGRKEVWDKAPKEITIDNHAFEIISSESVDGVITELGVFKPEVLVEEIEDEYPWMFKH